MASKHPQLKVQKRELTGKKVKKLRKEGILPGNIYGKGITSTSIQLPYKEFDDVFDEVGYTGLVDLDLDGTIHPVLIHDTHDNPVTDQTLHVDFFQVNLKEKIKSMIPLELVGEAQAVAEKIGLLMEQTSEVEVEALPDALPEKIDVDVTTLAQVGDQLTAGDLKIPSEVTLITDPSIVIVRVAELVSKEAEEEAKEEAAAAEEAKEEGAAEASENAEEVKEEAKDAKEEPKKE